MFILFPHSGYNFGIVLISHCNITSSPKGNDRSPEKKQVFSNSSQVGLKIFSIGQGQPTPQSMVGQNSDYNKGRNSVANLQKK